MQNRRGVKFWFLLSLITLSGLILYACVSSPQTDSGKTTFPEAASPVSEDFPAEPILRLETGMHTAAIWRIDVDRDQRFLISGSDDKTVRIWELKTGRLLRTLRVPLGEGNLGKVLLRGDLPGRGLRGRRRLDWKQIRHQQ